MSLIYRHITLRRPIVAVTLAAAVSAGAVTVRLDSRGSLAARLASLPSTTPDLTLEGVADAAELMSISSRLPELTSLDLSRLNLTPAEIPPYAFAGTKLGHIALPEAVAVIGEGAFAAIPATDLTLPARLDSIAPHAFAHSRLRQLTLPASLRAIGRRAFADCQSLSSITVTPGALANIGPEAFCATAIGAIDLSQVKSLKLIGDHAFEGCKSLTSVRLPKSAGYTIGQAAFFACSALTTLDGPTLTHVPPMMLAATPDVRPDAIVGNGTVTIGGYALSGNQASHLELPATLDSIGDHAMERMTQLRTVKATTLQHVPALGDEVWDGTDTRNVILTVAPGMPEAFHSADQWCEFDIRSTLSGDDNIEADNSGIAIAADAYDLIVTSPTPLAMIDIVTPDGKVVARIRPATDTRGSAADTDATQVRITTATWPGPVAIIRVTPTTGPARTFTVTRHRP